MMLPPAADPPRPAHRRPVRTDILFGVVVPLGCLIFDPFVFRAPEWGRALLRDYALFGYAAAGFGMAALSLWLAVGSCGAILDGCFAGALAGSGVFALCMGVVLLPFSLLGLAVVVGVFGFTPFATAWVFARNARRAWVATRRSRDREDAALCALFGFLFAFVGPFAVAAVVGEEVDREVRQLLSAEPDDIERRAEDLWWLPLVPGDPADALVRDCRYESNPARRAALEKAYHKLTGRNLSDREHVLRFD